MSRFEFSLDNSIFSHPEVSCGSLGLCLESISKIELSNVVLISETIFHYFVRFPSGSEASVDLGGFFKVGLV